jgi:hypothetical protein
MANIQIVTGREALALIEQDQNQTNSLRLHKVVETFRKMSRLSDFDFQDISDVQVRTREDQPVEMAFTLGAKEVSLSVVYSKERPTMVKIAIGSKLSDQLVYTEEVTWRLTKSNPLTTHLTDFFVGELDELMSNAKPLYAAVAETQISTYEFLGRAILSDAVTTPVLNTMVQTIKDQYPGAITFKLPYAALIMQSAIAANTVAFLKTEEVAAFKTLTEGITALPNEKTAEPEEDDTTGGEESAYPWDAEEPQEATGAGAVVEPEAETAASNGEENPTADSNAEVASLEDDWLDL